MLDYGKRKNMAKENIYEFTLKKKIKKQVETKRKGKDGEEETVLSNRTVSVPVKFFVKKPTRRMADEAEVFYSIQLSKAIKMGIVTKAMLIKKYADNGGALSEDESKLLLKSLKNLNDLENEYKLCSVKKTKESKERSEELELEIVVLKRELQELESSLQSVYQHTADSKAEKEVLLWYAIQLARFSEEEKEEKVFFKGMDFEEQLEDLYEKYEDEESFESEATSNICRVVGYWFYNQSAEKKDIEAFIEQDGQ
tara:strand:- start:304 stop:1065 length:762 start_codon:yes stop_codon:yes gene_type:complete